MNVFKALFLAAFVAGSTGMTNDASASGAALDTQIAPPPPAGKGELVFFRSAASTGWAISCAVHEGGTTLTSLPPGHYAVVVAEPGKHVYAVQSEAKDTLNVDVEAGEIQYASCVVKQSLLIGRPALVPSTEADFFSRKYKLVEPKTPPAQAR